MCEEGAECIEGGGREVGWESCCMKDVTEKDEIPKSTSKIYWMALAWSGRTRSTTVMLCVRSGPSKQHNKMPLRGTWKHAFAAFCQTSCRRAWCVARVLISVLGRLQVRKYTLYLGRHFCSKGRKEINGKTFSEKKKKRNALPQKDGRKKTCSSTEAICGGLLACVNAACVCGTVNKNVISVHARVHASWLKF